MAKKNYYAVAKGHKTGIYLHWYGEDGAEVQVKGYTGAVYKGFATKQEAKKWLEQQSQRLALANAPKDNQLQKNGSPSPPPETGDTVIIYTDGACSGNPGRGGYAAVILHQGHRTEISGGFTHTTNNRMELTACIAAL